MKPGDRKKLTAALLRWYIAHHRKMPWRAAVGERGEPYAVLVSETMLQQTQVVTVIDYFKRFMTELPTLAALAAAPEQQVLRLWQGLGYYRRARNLHAAAQAIVRDHGGIVPQSTTQLLELPGIGRYTAGAIASIAFAQPEPLVDGNVIRVLSRLLAIAGSADDPAVKQKLWKVAAELIGDGAWMVAGSELHAGDFNQAVMELGATVCLPRNPQCGTCPVAAHCRARAMDRMDDFPAAKRRAAPRAVVHRILAIRRGAELLFRKRGDEGLWAGLWEMPTLEGGADADFTLKKWVHADFSLQIAAPQLIGKFTHVTTHRRIGFELWRANLTGGRLRRGTGVWRQPENLSDLPLSSAQQKAVRLLTTSPGPDRGTIRRSNRAVRPKGNRLVTA